MDDVLDDTHLCIKCKQTIIGLENYIQHRKQKCATSEETASSAQQPKLSIPDSNPRQQIIADITPAISYETFSLNEPEPTNTVSHDGKTVKTLGESYELHYELEADVFFSSLQLQSVQSTGTQQAPPVSGGKTGNSQNTGSVTRQKSLQLETEANGAARESWINTESTQQTITHQSSGEHFLKDNVFKNVTYEQDFQEVTEEEEDDEEADADIYDDDDDEDDEDYDPLAEVHGSGGKWKLPPLRNSPPVVPVTHTGGKWKPENRPDLRIAHSQLSRTSPMWDDNVDDADAQDGQHPPDDHTKGKWLPGTKVQRLEYKEVVQLAKCSKSSEDYWCNICCRKLKSKTIYENHLKSHYHLRRTEPELQLEKAVIKGLLKEDINKTLPMDPFKPISITIGTNINKRKRRCTYFKCTLCKHVVVRHLIGKHLISHYHYRRMQLHPLVSLPIILEHIHAIVLQSPFQCRPCRFYANTEDTFLLHWNSASHLDISEGPGRFWCSYCQFECEDNNQMRRHLLSSEHKEVILVINRSVPICISKRLSIDCPKCCQSFRFNFEIRRHFKNYHPDVELIGTASDTYQSKFKCSTCPEVLPSKISLQRHEKFKHFISKYFCSICNMEFKSPCQARKHRKTLEHKQNAFNINQKTMKKDQIRNLFELKTGEKSLAKEDIEVDYRPSTSDQAKNRLPQLKIPAASKTFKCSHCFYKTSSKEELKLHAQKEHVFSQHNCILCSSNFGNAQELGRHTRLCKPTIIPKAEKIKSPNQLQEVITDQGQKMWLCDLCDFKSPFQSETLFHRIFHSYISEGKNQLLPCPLCHKQFRKQSLRFHLHNHTKENIFKCNICNSTFSRPNNLKDHLHNIHGEGRKRSSKLDKTFPCLSCDKVFKSKHSMKMHHTTHHTSESNLKKETELFQCPRENCIYSSTSKSLLKTHMNSHAAESFKCTKEDCNYVGKSKLHLKRHLHYHVRRDDINNFICKHCDFKTKIKAHLVRHTRQHTGEKPFLCPHCDFRCATSENLRKHILKTGKHTGKYVFECQKCVEELHEVVGEQEGKSKQMFKTNSYQEYRHHLKTAH